MTIKITDGETYTNYTLGAAPTVIKGDASGATLNLAGNGDNTTSVDLTGSNNTINMTPSADVSITLHNGSGELVSFNGFSDNVTLTDTVNTSTVILSNIDGLPGYPFPNSVSANAVITDHGINNVIDLEGSIPPSGNYPLTAIVHADATTTVNVVDMSALYEVFGKLGTTINFQNVASSQASYSQVQIEDAAGKMVAAEQITFGGGVTVDIVGVHQAHFVNGVVHW
jgi:hypothetical protein